MSLNHCRVAASSVDDLYRWIRGSHDSSVVVSGGISIQERRSQQPSLSQANRNFLPHLAPSSSSSKLHFDGRTVRANTDLRLGEVLFEVPRTRLFYWAKEWDDSRRRDDLLRQSTTPARSSPSGKTKARGAVGGAPPDATNGTTAIDEREYLESNDEARFRSIVHQLRAFYNARMFGGAGGAPREDGSTEEMSFEELLRKEEELAQKQWDENMSFNQQLAKMVLDEGADPRNLVGEPGWMRERRLKEEAAERAAREEVAGGAEDADAGFAGGGYARAEQDPHVVTKKDIIVEEIIVDVETGQKMTGRGDQGRKEQDDGQGVVGSLTKNHARGPPVGEREEQTVIVSDHPANRPPDAPLPAPPLLHNVHEASFMAALLAEHMIMRGRRSFYRPFFAALPSRAQLRQDIPWVAQAVHQQELGSTLPDHEFSFSPEERLVLANAVRASLVRAAEATKNEQTQDQESYFFHRVAAARAEKRLAERVLGESVVEPKVESSKVVALVEEDTGTRSYVDRLVVEKVDRVLEEHRQLRSLFFEFLKQNPESLLSWCHDGFYDLDDLDRGDLGARGDGAGRSGASNTSSVVAASKRSWADWFFGRGKKARSTEEELVRIVALLAEALSSEMFIYTHGICETRQFGVAHLEISALLRKWE